MYFHIEQIDLSDEPLKWWEHNSINFKTLNLIAKIYCVFQQLLLPVRAYSKAGNIISNKKAALDSKFAAILIFLAENQE